MAVDRKHEARVSPQDHYLFLRAKIECAQYLVQRKVSRALTQRVFTNLEASRSGSPMTQKFTFRLKGFGMWLNQNKGAALPVYWYWYRMEGYGFRLLACSVVHCWKGIV
jgi:hypothetical protein